MNNFTKMLNFSRKNKEYFRKWYLDNRDELLLKSKEYWKEKKERYKKKD